jgi:hypothetical protein
MPRGRLSAGASRSWPLLNAKPVGARPSRDAAFGINATVPLGHDPIAEALAALLILELDLHGRSTTTRALWGEKNQNQYEGTHGRGLPLRPSPNEQSPAAHLVVTAPFSLTFILMPVAAPLLSEAFSFLSRSSSAFRSSSDMNTPSVQRNSGAIVGELEALIHEARKMGRQSQNLTHWSVLAGRFHGQKNGPSVDVG